MSSVNISRPFALHRNTSQPDDTAAPRMLRRVELTYRLALDCMQRPDCDLVFRNVRQRAEVLPARTVIASQDTLWCRAALQRTTLLPLGRAFAHKPWLEARTLVGPTLSALHVLCPSAALIAATQLMLAVRRDMHAIISLTSLKDVPSESLRQRLKLPVVVFSLALAGRVAIEQALCARDWVDEAPYALARHELVQQPHLLFGCAAACLGLLFTQGISIGVGARTRQRAVACTLGVATLILARADVEAQRTYPLHLLLAIVHLGLPLLLLEHACASWQAEMHELRERVDTSLAQQSLETERYARTLGRDLGHRSPFVALNCLSVWEDLTPATSRLTEKFSMAYETGAYEALADELLPLASPTVQATHELLPGSFLADERAVV